MQEFKPGIIICSRLDSERIPNKVLRRLNGVPVLVHLLRQLVPIGIPIVVTFPEKDKAAYFQIDDEFEKEFSHRVYFKPSHLDKDPLARTVESMNLFGFSHVVRITHDKIFVDTDILKNALLIARHSKERPDYIYSNSLTPGTGFELISSECLHRAKDKYKNVEHITYAARLHSKLSLDLISETKPWNLLIDFPEDLKLMEVIYATLGNDIRLKDVNKYLQANPYITKINKPPTLTVYTCAFNAEKTIEQTMKSVEQQRNYIEGLEYIIIDDHSTDRTTQKIAAFAIGRPWVSWYRNPKNEGLSTSSNLALARARASHIVRLDADDIFLLSDVLNRALGTAKALGYEAMYPDNFFGSFQKIQQGREKHHVGGAIFQKKALNFLKFTDGLRNHDSLDLFVRAKDSLVIGYFNEPLFFYTQREGSMSKTNLEERKMVETQLISGLKN